MAVANPWIPDKKKSLQRSQLDYLPSQDSNEINKATLKNKLDWNYLNLKKRVSENNPDNLFLFKRGILLTSNSQVKVFTKYEVFDLVGKNCITVNDGQKIYDLVHPQLQANQPVE
ncbi:MAG: hypothetical protein ACLBM2_07310, partial [Dolichospermum sp.]